MATANVNGITIGYDVIGDGEPMLLLMGLATQRIFWHDDFVKMLAAEGYQAIRLDNRDIGESTHFDDSPPPTRGQLAKALVHRRFATRAPYRLVDMADDAAGLLDHLGIERAHVVGLSMGGMIAQSLAIGHAGRVRSLTSIMSNTGNRRYGRVAPKLMRRALPLLNPTPENRVAASLEMWRLISGPHFDAEENRLLIQRAAEISDDRDGTARQTLAIAASPDRTPMLRRLDVPALVIHGLLDRLVLPSGGVATARAIPGSRLLMFPDMAHDMPRPRWDEIMTAIVANARRAG
jgi:pimeloyl-ACP methyl ester carboxylesterase